MTRVLLFVLVALWVGTMFGWVYAHNTVADECKKLNSFYVGDKVYFCEVR